MEEKGYYGVDAVSNSAMNYIEPQQGGSPAKYKANIVDGDKTQEETPSLQNGKLIHLYVEDPGEFVISDVERPTEMVASWVEEVFKVVDFSQCSIHEDDEELRRTALMEPVRGDRYKSIKDEDKVWARFCAGLPYLEYLMAGTDNIVMTSAQKVVVENCIHSLRDHELANELLFKEGEEFGDEAFNEQEMYWEEELDGQKIACKGLADRIRILPSQKLIQLIDLKTTGKPGSLFKKSFMFYRYYRQLAWYLLGLFDWLKKTKPQIKLEDGWAIEAYIVAVETGGLHETTVHKISEKWIKEGTSEAARCLVRIATAFKDSDWKQSLEEREAGGFKPMELTNEDRRQIQRG